MQKTIDRRSLRRRVRFRIRRKISGTAERPRVAVYRSGKHIYVQAIDDEAGRTLAHASTLDADIRGQVARGGTRDAAKVVGAAVAEKLKKHGVEEVVLDRGGFLYHGRVQALADSAREAGLKF